MKTNITLFNLDATLCCGQVFRWNKKGEWWYGIASDQVFKIRQKNTELEFFNIDETFILHYFGLKDNLKRIHNLISRDEHIEKALWASSGLRIVRQDPWECLISYICATYKSIPAIRLMLLKLSKKFGERITLDGHDFFTFPSPKKLAKATKNSLAECGLGYRAKYVLETSKKICEGALNLESLRGISYQQAKKALMSLSGVGQKVADCILLFSLERLDAFPVDVWVKRAIVNHYADHFPRELIQRVSCRGSLSGREYDRLNAFGRNYFGNYAGYAQEYLYHYERAQR